MRPLVVDFCEEQNAGSNVVRSHGRIGCSNFHTKRSSTAKDLSPSTRRADTGVGGSLMRAPTVRFIVAWLLTTQVAFAADSKPTAPAPAQWTTVKAVTADFGPDLRDANVQLLKSVEERGHDGAGAPLYWVNVVVSKAGRVAYQFIPLAIPSGHDERHALVFYMDDLLELRDVTGDHVPEIIFHAGDRGASDFVSQVHVLQYRPAIGRFVDIRDKGFSESVWDRFRWLEFHRRTLALVADPLVADPPVADPIEPPLDPAWNGSPSRRGAKFHQYVVYGWNPKHQSFRVLHTIPTTHQEHDAATDPFALDAKYIREKLEEYREQAHRPRR